MNEQYEKLRQVIIAANPEIMEWRCEGCNRRYAEYVNGCVQCWCDELPREDNLKIFPNRSVKLSPREIRLADVLLTIQASGKGLNEQIRIATNGVWVSGSMSYDIKTPEKTYWNLKDDNLDHQSEETKQFLISLLVK